MFETNEIFLYVSIAINALFLLWFIHLEFKTRDIKILKNNESLVKKIKTIDDRLDNLQIFENKTKEDINLILNKLETNIQNIEIIRFNPFKEEGIGGDQSFAVSLLNKKGDGLLLSSLYSREKVSVFAKPINNWQSKYELSKEEADVLERTKKKSN
ncbi:MAG: DUF4446 family protein [Candidatus Pacebacteria bacterium]|nr:DUF4446 family protein [Candidatus Paceibacterota bacterium]